MNTASIRGLSLALVAIFVPAAECQLLGAKHAAAQSVGRPDNATSSAREVQTPGGTATRSVLDRFIGKRVSVQGEDGRKYTGSLLKTNDKGGELDAISVYSATSSDHSVHLSAVQITEITCEGQRIFPAGDEYAAVRQRIQELERQGAALELAERNGRIDEARRQRLLAARESDQPQQTNTQLQLEPKEQKRQKPKVVFYLLRNGIFPSVYTADSAKVDKKRVIVTANGQSKTYSWGACLAVYTSTGSYAFDEQRQILHQNKNTSYYKQQLSRMFVVEERYDPSLQPFIQSKEITAKCKRLIDGEAHDIVFFVHPTVEPCKFIFRGARLSDSENSTFELVFDIEYTSAFTLSKRLLNTSAVERAMRTYDQSYHGGTFMTMAYRFSSNGEFRDCSVVRDDGLYEAFKAVDKVIEWVKEKLTEQQADDDSQQMFDAVFESVDAKLCLERWLKYRQSKAYR